MILGLFQLEIIDNDPKQTGTSSRGQQHHTIPLPLPILLQQFCTVQRGITVWLLSEYSYFFKAFKSSASYLLVKNVNNWNFKRSMNTRRSVCKTLTDLHALSIWMPNPPSYSQGLQSIYEDTLTRHSLEKSIKAKPQQIRKGQPKNHSCMPQGNTKNQQTCEIARAYTAKACSQEFWKKVISSTSQWATEDTETCRAWELQHEASQMAYHIPSYI